MQKNLYYHATLGRENHFKNFFLGFFSSFSSYGRLLIEVFTRKNFGERYFQFSSAITVAVILILLPFIPTSKYEMRNVGGSISMAEYATWYLFIAAFLYFSFLRYKEVQRNPSVFDFARFSLSAGKILPFFYTIKLAGKKPTIRQISTLIEPAIVFISGILLWLLHQKVGILFTIISIIYSASWSAAYHVGDNFVMDKIDEMICNEELKSSFVDGKDQDETRGFQFVGRKPTSAEMRKQLLPLLMTDDEQKDQNLDVK